MKKFTILGLGWYGYALAKSLENRFHIKASFKNSLRKDALKNESFDKYILNEVYFDELNFLLDTDFLLINFPPSKFNNYLEFLKKIYNHPKIKNIKKIFFISSTSIYPNIEANFDESYIIEKTKSKRVFEAEQFVKNKTDIILRCAGLMGYDRIPGRYFSGKTIDNGNLKVNFTHRDDLVNVIHFFLNNDYTGIYNVCSQDHPSRKEIYDYNCKKFGFEKIIYTDKNLLENRIINSNKIRNIGYVFLFDNIKDYKY